MRAQYAGEISYLDAELRRVLEHPRLAAGAIAVTSDHGEGLGDHNIFWNHIGLYPDMLHVPLILALPDGPRGVRSERPTRQWDLGHTLLLSAGLDATDFPGRNLLDDAPGDEPLFAISSWQQQAAIRHREWLLMLTLEEFPRNRDESYGHFVRHAVELYNVAQDPRCATNLVEPELERARRMRASLIEWLGRTQTPTLVGSAQSGPSPELLAELGYASGSTDAGSFDPNCRCDECARFD